MYGLVLEGGGARGSYEIGVFKAMQELGIKVGAVTGTSVGALNGAFYAQGRIDEAYEVWYNMDPRLVLDTDTEIFQDLINFNFKAHGIKSYFSYFKNIIHNKGLDISPLKELIATHVDEKTFRESEIDFGLVTISTKGFKPIEVFLEDIPEGEVHNYLLASAYLPGFKSEELNGTRYLDGGLFDNAPINLVAKKGYKDIIVVRLKAVGLTKKPKIKNLNIIEISPTDSLGSILDFDADLARKNIEIGYYDALRVLGDYFGKQYCISDMPTEQEIESEIVNVSEVKIEKTLEFMGLDKGYPKRVLLEKVIPKLAKMCDLDHTHSYRDIYIAILEELAEYYEINRMKKYTHLELLEELQKAYLHHTDEKLIDDDNPIADFINSVHEAASSNKYISRLNKTNVFIEMAIMFGILHK